jgi:calcium-dependent protein kinase
LAKFEKSGIFFRELEILKTLDHPNIIKFYETYKDEKYYHLVMEYCSGGELMEKLAREGKINESMTRKIMKKLFSAVNYLHERGICHRDLKPENFLFMDKGKDTEIKIIDFGLSKIVENLNSLKTIVGTALYVAPEVLRGKYDKRCDNWSLGVILYLLLSGVPPFFGHTNEDIFSKLKNGSWTFRPGEWNGISKEAKDLISRLLVHDPDKRLTSQQASTHIWFKIKLKGAIAEEEEIPKRVDPKIICLLKEYKFTSSFKREVLRIMVRIKKFYDFLIIIKFGAVCRESKLI